MPVFIQVFFAIFGVMDPVGNTPFFITLTNSLDKKEKRAFAARGLLYAGGILLVFMFLGNFILNAFQVSMESFRIAGGLVLLVLGFQMLFNLEFEKKEEDISEEKDASIIPLATPLIAGPGTISSVVILSKEFGYAYTFLAIAINLALCFILFSFADIVPKLLGKKGTMVFANIMGLILMAVGVEFVRSAL
jgi:multiple antibiotic resistance protein